jgi:hypothetical protein
VNPAGRIDPLALLGGVAERFPAIRAAAGSGAPSRDRDAFLLLREVNELMQSLRPEEGLGEEVGGLAALLHAAYLYWLDGRQLIVVDDPELSRRLAIPPAATPRGSPRPGARYIQLPPLRVFGFPIAGASAEPLDGWFAEGRGSTLTVVALFGLHPAREGVTVVEVSGVAPEGLAREGGAPLFAPTLAGGRAAGLASLEGAEELLELAWRMERG